ncbi:adhesion G protein-coupled receptor L1-like isoform X1 [Anopheles cruzii]|uniref:adhesion G protein-coupled receptor L1-like isoform X1 n=2 Tax=Anopheles cruzii TaxID=68878 RepID=UPI0022EC67D0|nr:adhesion G protein-coupled receptor L1-like isoform X1 [Anopheles cruzii]XP_052865402.1 adhesion G protein-coupled receptor L1-like isoform X1 [Anopheles cruzii]XP_052865404.1 adhesion G protein-coupled receptor L1-like isoform X1 [Anopheles cruzii]
METLYTGHIHGFPPSANISYGSLSTTWGSQGGLIALGVVLGSSVSLVGLAFAFITYSLFSDLKSLAGTALLSLLASLFMSQLLFVIGVGGVQDAELCLSLSLALLFMKLASLCWLCCCCHHALAMFRSNTNIHPNPEPSMGKALANYSLISWGFPSLMLGVAAAFKYKERDIKISGAQVIAQIVHELNGDNHCWLMEGSAYIWGFLMPAIVLLFSGFYLACQGGGAIKIAAALQIDSRAKNKLVKKRGLQIGLFFKILVVLSSVVCLGAVASVWNVVQLWSIYSIAQGVQGLVISLLVSCNCKVLKLYSAPRSHKARRGTYRSLKDGDGGRYGVISITNPNYEEMIPNGVGENSTSLTKMSYKEKHFVDRIDNTLPTLDCAFNGELSTSLSIDELPKRPLPASV